MVEREIIGIEALIIERDELAANVARLGAELRAARFAVRHADRLGQLAAAPIMRRLGRCLAALRSIAEHEDAAGDVARAVLRQDRISRSSDAVAPAESLVRENQRLREVLSAILEHSDVDDELHVNLEAVASALGATGDIVEHLESLAWGKT